MQPTDIALIAYILISVGLVIVLTFACWFYKNLYELEVRLTKAEENLRISLQECVFELLTEKLGKEKELEEVDTKAGDE